MDETINDPSANFAKILVSYSWLPVSENTTFLCSWMQQLIQETTLKLQSEYSNLSQFQNAKWNWRWIDSNMYDNFTRQVIIEDYILHLTRNGYLHAFNITHDWTVQPIRARRIKIVTWNEDKGS